jgi:hypothetical protein
MGNITIASLAGLLLVGAPLGKVDEKEGDAKPTLKLTLNEGNVLTFEAAASVPLHRVAPEHFKLEEIGKGSRVGLSFYDDAEGLREKIDYKYNRTWKGGRLCLTNREDKDDRLRKATEHDAGFVDLFAEAHLDAGKRYRLTWACWPIGAKAAVEVSRNFDLSEKPAVDTGIVALELKASKTTIKEGESIEWTAHLINRGKKDVTVVKPGDGSNCGWRTPIIQWRIDGKGPRDKESRCGNINRLKPDEVFTLKAGVFLKLDEWVGRPSVSHEGKYKVTLRYANLPDLKWQGVPLGEHDKAAMEKVRGSSRVIVESNVVEITVEKK